MSAAEKLLARLDGIRKMGAGKWMARCPVHEDRTASLSVRDLDGKVLLNCFGCGAGGGDVVAALGLTLGDLFDAPLAQHRYQPSPPGVSPRDAIAILDHELTKSVLLLEDARTRLLTDEERDQIATAAARIGKVRDYFCPVEVKVSARR